MIYPNIVNMLGDSYVEVNAICLDPTETYILMIEEREVSSSREERGLRSLLVLFSIRR